MLTAAFIVLTLCFVFVLALICAPQDDCPECAAWREQNPTRHPIPGGHLERGSGEFPFPTGPRSLCDSSSLHSATPTQKGQHRHA